MFKNIVTLIDYFIVVDIVFTDYNLTCIIFVQLYSLLLNVSFNKLEISVFFICNNLIILFIILNIQFY